MPTNVNFSTLVALSLFLTGSDSISDVWQQDGEGNCNCDDDDDDDDDDDRCSSDDEREHAGIR